MNPLSSRHKAISKMYHGTFFRILDTFHVIKKKQKKLAFTACDFLMKAILRRALELSFVSRYVVGPWTLMGYAC
jgi:hypothetical protein